MHFILIHGSESAGYGRKTDLLRQYFGQDAVINPNYPPDRQGAIGMFEYLVERLRDDPDLYLVGSSQGGLFSIYLSYKYGVKAILINPLIDANPSIYPIGEEVENFKTGKHYVLKREWIEFMKNLVVPRTEIMKMKDRLFIYLDEGDDLLDSFKTAKFFGSDCELYCSL